MKLRKYQALAQWQTWCFMAGLTACSQQPALVTNAESMKQPASTVTLVKGGQSYFRGVIREVVRDSTRWMVLRDSIPRHLNAPGSDSPAVDFRREMLVVAVGPSGPDGDSVVIRQVSRTDQGISALVVFHRECSAFMRASLPFHVVRIPLSPGAAVFEEKEVSGRDC